MPLAVAGAGAGEPGRGPAEAPGGVERRPLRFRRAVAAVAVAALWSQSPGSWGASVGDAGRRSYAGAAVGAPAGTAPSGEPFVGRRNWRM